MFDIELFLVFPIEQLWFELECDLEHELSHLTTHLLGHWITQILQFYLTISLSSFRKRLKSYRQNSQQLGAGLISEIGQHRLQHNRNEK